MAEFNSRGHLGNEQFGFRHRLSTTLELARLIDTAHWRFCLIMAKTVDSVWNEGLLHSRIFVAAFQVATSSCRLMRSEVAHGELIPPVVFSFYVNDILTPSRHIELAQFADDIALVATFRQPALLVKYLATHLSDLKIWVRDWRIAINVGKSVAVFLTT